MLKRINRKNNTIMSFWCDGEKLIQHNTLFSVYGRTIIMKCSLLWLCFSCFFFFLFHRICNVSLPLGRNKIVYVNTFSVSLLVFDSGFFFFFAFKYSMFVSFVWSCRAIFCCCYYFFVFWEAELNVVLVPSSNRKLIWLIIGKC